MNLIKEKKVAKSRRQFFLGLGAFLLLLACWRNYRGLTSLPLGVGGAFLVLVELIVPTFAAVLFKAWMAFAKVLGKINATVLISIIYIAMILPIGIFRRLKGSSKKELNEFKTKKSSWQLLGTPPTKESYYNPY